MLFRTLLSFSLLFSASQVLGGEATVLTPTTYPEVGTEWRVPKNKWLALNWKENDWNLAPANVKLKRDGEDTTVISSIADTFYLLRAMGLKPGPVTLVGGEPIYAKPVGRLITDHCFSGGACKQKYVLNSKTYGIEFVAIGENEQRGVSAHTGKLVLRQLSPQKFEQVLKVVKDPAMSFWRSQVVGDLDGDGKLDLIEPVRNFVCEA